MVRNIRRAALVAGLAGALLTACTSSHETTAPPTKRPPAPSRLTPSAATTAYNAVPTAVGRPDCHPPSNVGGIPTVAELAGAGDGIQMWGLVQTVGPLPLRVREDVKIVWRVTGRGPLHLSSIDPSGRTHRLQWGPERHSGSSFNRPGQEWGAGYRFGTPGCWTLRAVRGHASADAWVRIAAVG